MLIIGFFCGTWNHCQKDEAFKSLQHTFNENNGTVFIEGTTKSQPITPQQLFAYNGCDTQSTGLFAKGAIIKARQFVQDVLTQLTNCSGPYPINIVLTGCSRGALSAMLVAKWLCEDADFKSKIKLRLLLRDPVPGNLPITIRLAKEKTIAHLAYDLSQLDAIISVVVTIQEYPYFPAGFNSLLPLCHPDTYFSVASYPGGHDIQQRKTKWLIDNMPQAVQTTLFKLGELQLQKTLLEAGMVIKNIDIKALQIEQLTLMDKVLSDIKTHKSLKKKHHSRSLHHEGKAKAFPQKAKTTVINYPHFLLKQQTVANPTNPLDEVPLYIIEQTHYNLQKKIDEHLLTFAFYLHQLQDKNIQTILKEQIQNAIPQQSSNKNDQARIELLRTHNHSLQEILNRVNDKKIKRSLRQKLRLYEAMLYLQCFKRKAQDFDNPVIIEKADKLIIAFKQLFGKKNIHYIQKQAALKWLDNCYQIMENNTTQSDVVITHLNDKLNEKRQHPLLLAFLLVVKAFILSCFQTQHQITKNNAFFKPEDTSSQNSDNRQHAVKLK